jgi:hypothetical protein
MVQRFRRLARIFWLFATSCIFTFDEHEKDLSKKLRKPFPRYIHLKRVADAIEKHRFVIILKPRQMMISWLVIAYALWIILFRKGERVLVVSKRQEDAYHLKERASAMLDNLPPLIKYKLLRVVEDNKSTIALSGGSSIHFLPASPSIGRTFTASLVILDEAAFHPWAEEIYTSLVPTLSGGGSLVVLSTPNGVGGTFHTIWQNYKDRGFHRVLLNWHEHPDRDQDWYDETTKPLSTKRIAQEYGCDFIQSGSSVFDSKKLAVVPRPARKVIREWIADAKERGNRSPFYIGIDVGEGHDESDNSSISIIHAETGIEILTYAAKLRPDVFAVKIVEHLDRFLGPIGVEKNGPGGALILKLQELGYDDRLYRHKDYDARGKAKRRVGWITSAKSKPIMIDELEAAIREKVVSITDEDLLAELLVYEYKGTLDHSGAPDGYKDDRVISLAVAYQMRRSALRGSRNVERR